MSSHAYIKLVPASAKETITLNEIKDLFFYYKEITSKTGQQLSWEYADAAFPYEIINESNSSNDFLTLKSAESRYNTIVIGVGSEQIQRDEETREQHFIQISLPTISTHGDKGKSNEFCKYLAKKLEAELHLFNGRIMYFYKRK